MSCWCGDPQLRPMGGTTPWLAVDEDDHERRLVRLVAADAVWSAGLDAVDQLLVDHDQIVVLVVGSVAVLGSLDGLVAFDGDAVFVARRTGAIPDDGRWPAEADLAHAGRAGDGVAVFRRGSAGMRAWLRAQLASSESIPIGRRFERTTVAFDGTWCEEPGIGAGAWRWPDAAPVALLDATGFDAAQPWVLVASTPAPLRTSVAEDAGRRAVIDAALAQLAGAATAVVLPGGMPVDARVRSIARAIPDHPLPWTEASAFRAIVERQWWAMTRSGRPDLVAAFPDPEGADAAAFLRWQRRAFIDDDVPLVLQPWSPEAGSRPSRSADRFAVAADLRDDGLDLVGYLDHDLSLGDVGRRMLDALRAADVDVSTAGFDRTDSPRVDGAPRLDQRLAHRTSIAVVNADQFPALQVDHPEVFAAGRRTIGYWFWELEDVPKSVRSSFELVDEIWAGSRFVADAFRAVASVPVRHVPLPVPEPQPSNVARSGFEPLAGLDDRFVFLVAFDHFSVTERKNPDAAIAAFRRAFPVDGAGPVLVVKTMNGQQRWAGHQRVLAAAAGRSDIRVWDEHLRRDDQMALVASVDCLVSLHRSEGLGLHLAEAMWLGTPVIATRYSGNLDLMDDDCALLVDAALIPVRNGEGVYPSTSKWAEPDLDQAAAAMRRLVDQPSLVERLSTRGRHRMEAQPSVADAGRLIARLVREGQGS